MQLDFGFPVVEDDKQDSNVKYTVDISHLHYFYILVNSCGVLEKSKSKTHAKIADFTAILECDNEQIADEVLNCIKGLRKGQDTVCQSLTLSILVLVVEQLIAGNLQ